MCVYVCVRVQVDMHAVTGPRIHTVRRYIHVYICMCVHTRKHACGDRSAYSYCKEIYPCVYNVCVFKYTRKHARDDIFLFSYSKCRESHSNFVTSCVHVRVYAARSMQAVRGPPFA
jgi:hypothetical protein